MEVLAHHRIQEEFFKMQSVCQFVALVTTPTKFKVYVYGAGNEVAIKEGPPQETKCCGRTLFLERS